jgi:hypothetical protein
MYNQTSANLQCLHAAPAPERINKFKKLKKNELCST